MRPTAKSQRVDLRRLWPNRSPQRQQEPKPPMLPVRSQTARSSLEVDQYGDRNALLAIAANSEENRLIRRTERVANANVCDQENRQPV